MTRLDEAIVNGRERTGVDEVVSTRDLLVHVDEQIADDFPGFTGCHDIVGREFGIAFRPRPQMIGQHSCADRSRTTRSANSAGVRNSEPSCSDAGTFSSCLPAMALMLESTLSMVFRSCAAACSFSRIWRSSDRGFEFATVPASVPTACSS